MQGSLYRHAAPIDMQQYTVPSWIQATSMTARTGEEKQFKQMMEHFLKWCTYEGTHWQRAMDAGVVVGHNYKVILQPYST